MPLKGINFIRTEKGSLYALSDNLLALYNANDDVTVRYVFNLMDFVDENPHR